MSNPSPSGSSRRELPRSLSLVLPLLVAALFLGVWHGLVRMSGSDLFPTPFEVLRGLIELAQQGLLLKYITASLFRVSWGFMLAVIVGVPGLRCIQTSSRCGRGTLMIEASTSSATLKTSG